MLSRLTPNAEQESAIQRMLHSPSGSSLNGSLMSAGKTLMASEMLRRRGDKFVLLIAPINTFGGWKRTLARQGVEVPFRVINSTKEGKKTFADYQWEVPGIYAIGSELFARWSFEGSHTTKAFDGPHDMAIFDEAHRGQNRRSKTHKALMRVKAGYRHSMSGTISGNSFEGSYAPTRWLFPDNVGASFWVWRERWCATEYDRFAPNNSKVVGEKEPGKFFNSLPCYIRIEPRIDVERDQDQVYVTLSREQRKIYDELEKDMVTWVQSDPLVVELPITLYARLRQATLGTLTIADDGGIDFPEDCKSTKMDALFNLFQDDFEGESALVGVDSAKFARVAVGQINARYGDVAREWSGNTSQKQREEIFEDWKAGRVKYVVAVIPALAEGFDGAQHATRNVAFLSRSTSRIMNEQFISRVHRTGQTKLVRVREIVAEETLDDGVLSKQMLQALSMNRSLRAKIEVGN